MATETMATETVRGSPGALRREYAGYALLALGVTGITVAIIVGIVLADTLADIFGSDKAARDGAAASSSLLGDQGRVAALQAWVLPFAFLSLSSIITGIAIEFWAIWVEVRRRVTATREMLVAVRGRTG